MKFVKILIIAPALSDLERDCPESLILGRNLKDFCTRKCAKTMFSVGGFQLVLTFGTLFGWEWDRGFVDWILEWDLRILGEMELEKSKASDGSGMVAP